MREIYSIEKKEKVFFVGIGGVSMSGLAVYLKKLGYDVLGSDKVNSEQTENLVKNGIKVFIGHKKENVSGATIGVYSSAISNENPELLALKKSGARLIKRSELLGEIIKGYKVSVGVSGSHGKTTTTTMITEILKASCKSVTAFVGGESVSFGNLLIGNGDIIVFEACEYKKNFLDLKPTISVVLNIDDDHADTFVDEKDRVSTFNEYAKDSLCFYNKDDESASKLNLYTSISFGIDKRAVFRAINVRKNDLGYSFTIVRYNKKIERINLKIKGRHNVYNALVSFAVAYSLGVEQKIIKRSLENFGGVKRRNEFLGEFNGAKIYADYAHHPSEIKAYLDCFNENFKDVVVIFQPHTYSRTRALMGKFIECFSEKFPVYIYKTYPAREKHDIKGSGYTLYKELKRKIGPSAYYLKNETELKGVVLSKKMENKTILVIGAGDVYEKIKKFLIKN